MTMLHQTLLEIPFQPPEQVFTTFAREPGALLFDSGPRPHALGRYSFIAFEPLDLLTGLDDIPLSLTGRAPLLNAPLPFTGGLAGFFSYDLARDLETLPQHASAGDMFPALRLGVYDQVIGFDLVAQRAWYCCYADTQFDAAQRWNGLQKRIASTKSPEPNDLRLTLKPVTDRAAYLSAIETVIAYIEAGDIFQANLSQRFEALRPKAFDPYAHYLALRKMNPAPFSAYLNFGETILASTSPERFLQVKDGQIESRPIKGTDKDAARLAASEKDRAENIMIVDLLRNDLAKVCTDVSIAVPELCAVETYEGLSHLVSSVTGTLRPGVTALDALLACFPGGSITGAPKIRAMEIIDELEPSRRGPYCGAIGYLGFDGGMDMSIAIRTLIHHGDKTILNSGGGITAASDPATEYDETLLKAQKILESFG